MPKNNVFVICCKPKVEINNNNYRYCITIVTRCKLIERIARLRVERNKSTLISQVYIFDLIRES